MADGTDDVGALIREIEGEVPTELARAVGDFYDELLGHESIEAEEAYALTSDFLRHLLRVHFPPPRRAR